MKRFRSPFQKIQRIQLQLLRLEEIKLAQALAGLRAADERILNLELAAVDMESMLSRQLTPGQQLIRTADIIAARNWLENIRARLQKEARRREQLVVGLNKVQVEYRELKARCDGVEQLIDTQRAEHRRLTIRNEQDQLDESARTLERAEQFHSARFNGAGCDSEVKDGVVYR